MDSPFSSVTLALAMTASLATLIGPKPETPQPPYCSDQIAAALTGSDAPPTRKSTLSESVEMEEEAETSLEAHSVLAQLAGSTTVTEANLPPKASKRRRDVDVSRR